MLKSISFRLDYPPARVNFGSEEFSGWAEQVQRMVDVAAGKKLEWDMATGKERAEERRRRRRRRRPKEKLRS
jgi:hypothetical protein